MFKIQRLGWAVLLCSNFWLALSHAQAEPSLAGVGSFGYQLQNPNVSRLTTAPYDLVIIDYSKDGTEAEAFTASEIATIKNSGKKVLAYLSIGEAEEYRYYFKRHWIRAKSGAACGRARTRRAPAWLDEPNAAWCDNYKVKYWMRPWQRILFGVRSGPRKSYLDRIIDAGFDGVYLDIVDGYEYWRSRVRPNRRVAAASDMAALVIRLGAYARTTRGKKDFIVVPQNGAPILWRISSTQRDQYLASIQGIGAEDTFYFGSNDEDNPLDPQNMQYLLMRFLRKGKKVFAVDYLRDEEKIVDFARRACEAGFIPQVANRALDTLDTQVLNGCQCISDISGKVC